MYPSVEGQAVYIQNAVPTNPRFYKLNRLQRIKQTQRA